MNQLASYMQVSSYVDNIVLGAAAAETLTRPAGYGSCMITCDGELWMRRGGTAAEPAADVTDGTGSILVNSTMPRIVDFNADVSQGSAALSALSLFSTAGCNVSVEWFR